MNNVRAFLGVLILVGWQAVGLAAQYPSAEPRNPIRPSNGSNGVRFNFSDSGIVENPLRRSSANQDVRPVRPLRSRTMGIASDTQLNASIRLVQFEEEAVSLEDDDEVSLSPLERRLEREDGDDSEEDGDDSEEESELTSTDPPEPLPDPITSIRAPIRSNPFAEARQSDPRGLLADPELGEEKTFIEKYSDANGGDNACLVAGYNSHRLRHNPLYFEEPNLERYGNELQFQRIVSTAKFFSNAALLPLKARHAHPCSKVPTFGHRRPGEFVPYRHYLELPAHPGTFSNQ